MPSIDADRLLSDLRELRTIGAQGRGVVRPAFSAADMQARRWLQRQYEEAGLDATIDGVGNVLGRSRNSGKALLIGSHSDTQPTGGWLDGALGVIYALEVVRALAADRSTQALPVDAVSFQDEESRFVGCLGSRSLIGALDAGNGTAGGRHSGRQACRTHYAKPVWLKSRACALRLHVTPDSSRRTSNRVRIWRMQDAGSASSPASSGCAAFALFFAASRITPARR